MVNAIVLCWTVKIETGNLGMHMLPQQLTQCSQNNVHVCGCVALIADYNVPHNGDPNDSSTDEEPINHAYDQDMVCCNCMRLCVYCMYGIWKNFKHIPPMVY